MPAHLVTEETLHSSVIEYAALLDHFSGSNTVFADKLASFATEETEDEEPEYSDDIYAYISQETAETLAQCIPDTNLESVVNLVVLILNQQEPQQFETSVRDWFTNLIKAQQLSDKVEKNKKKTLKVLSLISNLSSVYNLDVSTQLKKWLLTQILDLVRVLDDFKILKPFVTNAESVVLSSNADEESRELLVKASELYSTTDEIESLRLLQLAATKISPASPQLIESLIVKSFNASKALDLTYLKSDSIITQHAPKDLISLVEQYLTTPTPEFSKILAAATSSYKLDTTTILNKNKILTLLTLAQKSTVLPYSTISTELNIPVSAVEITLIDAIKRGAIEGKMSQIDQEFHVYGVKLIVKKIEKEDWTQIKEKLLAHKKALAEVKTLIQNVKKNQKKN